MKVLVLISANKNSWHYIISDSAQAFKELGHKIHILPILKHRESIHTILKCVEEFTPDFIFTANNVGLCKEVIEKTKIPILSWITTEPQVLTKLPSRKGFIHLVVGECYVDEMKKQGYGNVFFLPLAANPRVFKRVSLSDDDIEKYGCDISFAGGCNYDIWYRRHKEGIDEFFSKEVVDRLIERHSHNTTIPIIDGLIATLEELGQIRDGGDRSLRNQLGAKIKEELMALHWAAMSKFRRDVIMGIKEFDLKLYGDDGWKDIKSVPGINLHPFIEDRAELVKLYNSSKINLNLPTSNHLTTSTFNIASSGVFMLTNHRDGLFRHFDEKKEIVSFRDLDELREKIGYYLHHPEERERIASNARQRVLEEHTFLHRMREVVQIVESRL